MNGFNQLSEYAEVDVEKRRQIELLMRQTMVSARLANIQDNEKYMARYAEVDEFMNFEDSSVLQSDHVKVCPECGRHFSREENFCPECLTSLKCISHKPSIRNITTKPHITCSGSGEAENILSNESIRKINDFRFTMDDFNMIARSIKAQAFEYMDRLIRDNSIDLDDLDILDKVLLFAKSFVSVEYKSYGRDLGYFEFNRIFIDDRQTKSLQITTIIHELTHFLLKEILVHVVCRILDVSKNKHVEAAVTYILTSSILNRLIDEYAAHSVEGRFTIFGYQDYSSFIALQDEIDEEHVEIAKTIANTFSIHIKKLLEGFLDWDLREEIKEQFLSDTLERPDYSQLAFESCSRLSDEGFLKAIWLILSEGFKDIDADVLDSYVKEL
ncbi:hypothetical protein [Methanobrevibacter sp.]|uniref:hypothetical protein n=1 Tax=Methanobrevibacter sp. TaxID=66852 RepID=UPI0026E0B1EA|nr:hypothetical protein [Methanobrevibacter sp.]MDO5859889.1 hypothetical protein [Methanobrevibacter sp.]